MESKPCFKTVKSINDKINFSDLLANMADITEKDNEMSEDIIDDTKVWTNEDMIKCVSKDNVNHPAHYTTNGGIECIEAIRASMDDYMYEGYLKANIMKYIWRYDKKNGLEDLEKAKVYLNWLIELKEND